MHATEGEIAATIKSVRECFHRLKAYGDILHADLGVNSSMRGVLESLGEQGPLTVPQVARIKGVSRQHIQLVINALADKGYVTGHSNPRDARSPLVEITAAGRDLLDTIGERETAILSAFAQQFSAADITTTQRTLDAFKHALLGLSATIANRRA